MVEQLDDIGDRLADPDHRHGTAADVADGPVEHAVVAVDAVHQLELAHRADDLLGRERQLLGDAHDQLRHTGVVHQRDRVARRLVGRDQHEVGKVAALRREHVADDGSLGAQEAHVEHPLVVEDLREVAAAGVGQQHDHDVARAELARDLERGVHRGAARAADEQALALRHPAGGEERVGVAHFDHAIDERRVEGRRPEVFADTLDEVRPPRPAGVHRTRRVGADDLHVRVLRLQVARRRR